MRYKALTDGGGHMMDFVALEKEYKDVIEYKSRSGNTLQK